MAQVTIALDVMSGDLGPQAVIPAALAALKRYPNLSILLVGDESLIAKELTLHGDRSGVADRITAHHASQIVTMEDLPSQALRGKRDSSMRLAINLVRDGQAQACVSAGNTGALMATARFVLKTLPGIDRPAIITALPTISGHTHMLDLGANIDCTAEQLHQFAVMGSVLTSAVDGNERPTVGLLNIGEEEIKGNEQVKEAARLISGSDVNYYGFVEGDDIYAGTTDVVVCDGFMGNVALKTSEGIAKMISHYIRLEFQRNILTRLVGLLALPVLRAFRSRIDPRNYNGASLVGLRGIVIKSHGSADAHAFGAAIDEAVVEVEKNIPERIKEHLASHLEERNIG